VGDEAASACSQVTTVERLLHDTLASVDQNILRPIQVSLKREENLACITLASYMLSHPLLCIISVALVLGQHGCACVVSGGDPGAGGSHRCGARLCHGGTCCRDFCPGGCWKRYFRVKDAEDRAALAERVALEKVSRVEVENGAALASARKDAKGFV
jgi:hypothetical protein